MIVSRIRRLQRTRMFKFSQQNQQWSISCQLLQCWEAARLQSPVDIKYDVMEWKCSVFSLQDWTHDSVFLLQQIQNDQQFTSMNMICTHEIYWISVCSGRGIPPLIAPPEMTSILHPLKRFLGAFFFSWIKVVRIEGITWCTISKALQHQSKRLKLTIQRHLGKTGTTCSFTKKHKMIKKNCYSCGWLHLTVNNAMHISTQSTCRS